MLRRLQSRHPIDLPRGKWGKVKIMVAVFGTLAVLAVLIPLLLSPLGAVLSDARDGGVPRALVLIVAGVGTLGLVLAVGAIKGKPGWDR